MTNILKAAAMALAASGLTLATPASAAIPSHAAPQARTAVMGDMSFEHGPKHNKWKRGRGNYGQSNYYSGYNGYDQQVYRDTRVWQGDDGRYYCRKENGTTGLLIGAGVGGLIGHEIAGRGDRTLGAILGAAGGALLGREIDRSSTRCR